uniref:C40 family peptidase n=1 Tax=Amycolatopsis sp. CA-151526 TaxID=3239921 RepID=UPI003F49B3C9
MIKNLTVGVIAGAVGITFALVLGLVVLGGGSSVADAAPGLRADQVPEPYRQWVIQAGQLCPDKIGPAVIAAQIEAESNWNPAAVSGAGAEGISQFMPGTWATWGRDDDGNGRASPFDPGDAIMAQGRFMCALADIVTGYIRDGRAQGEVIDLALAAYNAGPGGVLAAHGIPHNGQTEVYVARIRALMGKYAAAGGETLPGSTLGVRIVAAAATQLGKPYVWGGGNYTGPTGGGFDCSGLVMYALYQASNGQIALAQHLADWQVTQGTPVTGPAPGSAIDLSLLRPGDIIGFADGPGQTYHHIGIYAGNGQLLHAPDFGDVVKVAPMNTSYWAHQIWNVRRFR